MKFLKDLSVLPEALSLNYVTECNNLCLFLDRIINLTITFLLLGIRFTPVALNVESISFLSQESNSNLVHCELCQSCYLLLVCLCHAFLI